MENLDNIERVITWNCKKNSEDGTYTARVTSFDYEVEPVLHESFTYPTRAKAVSEAKKTVRFLKTKQEI